MSPPKFLIDTNVFVGAEDHKAIPPEIGELLNLAAKHGVAVYVHQAATEDIEQDADEKRRAASLSKIEKYRRIKAAHGLKKKDLEERYGELPKRNDVVDAKHLDALETRAADFLITQDKKLRARARRHAPHLSDQVLFVADAVAFLRQTYEPTNVPVRHVREQAAYEIPKNDKIFESLREGYEGFDVWWQKCCQQHRPCWVVYDDEELAGLIVRKDETSEDTDAKNKAAKVLKLCTFKVRPEKRGTKLGELLLRQALWFAQSNGYGVVYVTTYAEQTALIELLEYYGFQKTYTNGIGECVFEKVMTSGFPTALDGDYRYELARLNYPRFPVGDDVVGYTVPIKAHWHNVLFPDLDQSRQGSLLELPGLAAGPRRPGNTIRKVYLCGTKKNSIEPGSLLFFYKGKSKDEPSQSITVVGVAEGLTFARSTEDLIRLAGGRSVYSEAQMAARKASDKKPVKVIDFLIAGFIMPPRPLAELTNGIFGAHPPQSLAKMEPHHVAQLLQDLSLTSES